MYDINTVIYVEEMLDDLSNDYHLWYLYLVVKENNNIYIHRYNWKYNFEETAEKGYTNIYDCVLLKDIKEDSSEKDFIEIKKKLELNIEDFLSS